MKRLLASILVLAGPVPSVSRAHDDFELRQALLFLNGRVEFDSPDNPKRVRTVGWVVGALGLIPIAMAPWTDSHPEASVIRGAYVFPGAALVATGLLLNVSGYLYPILKRRMIGEDSRRFASDKNIVYFFKLPLAKQYSLASRDPELRAFVLDLAESRGLLARQPYVSSSAAR